MTHKNVVAWLPVSRNVMPVVLALGASTKPLVPKPLMRSPVVGSTFINMSFGEESTRSQSASPTDELEDE